MIVEDLRNIGVLGNPEEWFVPWSQPKDDMDYRAALSAIRKRATGENGIASIKVMANQLLDIEDGLQTYLKPKPGPRFFRFHNAFKDAKWVRIQRRNVVAQAISRVMAQQTGINHATGTAGQDHFAGNLLRGYSDEYNQGAKFNYNAILREATSITLENIAWDQFFRDFEIDPLVLTYEQVAKDPKMTHLDLIAELMGLDETPDSKPRTMVKVGNQRNKDFEKQFMMEAAENKYRAT
jgi:LPS sulfotransferase NodH